jgi:hypothetical protein
MRLAVLAAVLTFAGSLAGFKLAAAADAPGRDVRAGPPQGTELVVQVGGRCPAGRLWEEA